MSHDLQFVKQWSKTFLNNMIHHLLLYKWTLYSSSTGLRTQRHCPSVARNSLCVLSIPQQLASSRQAWLVNCICPDLLGHQGGCPLCHLELWMAVSQHQTIRHSSVSLLIQVTCVPRLLHEAPSYHLLSSGVSRAKHSTPHISSQYIAGF